jgi:hypothetical protein
MNTVEFYNQQGSIIVNSDDELFIYSSGEEEEEESELHVTDDEQRQTVQQPTREVKMDVVNQTEIYGGNNKVKYLLEQYPHHFEGLKDPLAKYRRWTKLSQSTPTDRSYLSYGSVIEAELATDTQKILNFHNIKNSTCRKLASNFISLELIRILLFMRCRAANKAELFKQHVYGTAWCFQFAKRHGFPRLIASTRNENYFLNKMIPFDTSDCEESPCTIR